MPAASVRLLADDLVLDPGHLLHRQRVLRRRENRRWLSIDRETWLDETADPDDVHARYNHMW